MHYVFPDHPRIAVDPKVCSGKPHIHGTRVTVSAILANLAGGMSIATLLDEFPRLTETDVFQALAFASNQLQDKYFPIELSAAA